MSSPKRRRTVDVVDAPEGVDPGVWKSLPVDLRAEACAALGLAFSIDPPRTTAASHTKSHTTPPPPPPPIPPQHRQASHLATEASVPDRHRPNRTPEPPAVVDLEVWRALPADLRAELAGDPDNTAACATNGHCGSGTGMRAASAPASTSTTNVATATVLPCAGKGQDQTAPLSAIGSGVNRSKRAVSACRGFNSTSGCHRGTECAWVHSCSGCGAASHAASQCPDGHAATPIIVVADAATEGDDAADVILCGEAGAGWNAGIAPPQSQPLEPSSSVLDHDPDTVELSTMHHQHS